MHLDHVIALQTINIPTAECDENEAYEMGDCVYENVGSEGASQLFR